MIGTVHPGNTPSPAITAMIPEIKKAVVITRSGSGILVATKPPAIKPRALEIIKSVYEEAVKLIGMSYKSTKAVEEKLCIPTKPKDVK